MASFAERPGRLLFLLQVILLLLQPFRVSDPVVLDDTEQHLEELEIA
jgi:hypothetical protein